MSFCWLQSTPRTASCREMIHKIWASGEESVSRGMKCWPSSLGFKTSRMQFGPFFMPSLYLTLRKLKEIGEYRMTVLKQTARKQEVKMWTETWLSTTVYGHKRQAFIASRRIMDWQFQYLNPNYSGVRVSASYVGWSLSQTTLVRNELYFAGVIKAFNICDFNPPKPTLVLTEFKNSVLISKTAQRFTIKNVTCLTPFREIVVLF
jgi:hypothetical protein